MGERARVGIFDSGIGGLTVLADVLRVCTNTDFFYFGDNGNAPYGGKSAEEILRLTRNAVRCFSFFDIDAVLLACNTATAVCAESLRSEFHIPVLGMEPAVKPAALHCKNVLVLATAGTASSARLAGLVSGCRDCRFTVCGLPHAAGEIERYFTRRAIAGLKGEGSAEKPPSVSTLLRGCDIPERDYDGVVLGCTHYLYFRREFSEYFGTRIFDGNEGVARELKRTLCTRVTTCEHSEPFNKEFCGCVTPKKSFNPNFEEIVPIFSPQEVDDPNCEVNNDHSRPSPKPQIPNINPNICFAKKQNNRVYFLGKWAKINRFIYNSNVCFNFK